jgi:hypothetical protein
LLYLAIRRGVQGTTRICIEKLTSTRRNFPNLSSLKVLNLIICNLSRSVEERRVLAFPRPFIPFGNNKLHITGCYILLEAPFFELSFPCSGAISISLR